MQKSPIKETIFYIFPPFLPLCPFLTLFFLFPPFFLPLLLFVPLRENMHTLTASLCSVPLRENCFSLFSLSLSERSRGRKKGGLLLSVLSERGSLCLSSTLSLFSFSHPHALSHVLSLFISLSFSRSLSLPTLHSRARVMGWLRLAGSIKLQVSFAKEPYKRDNILQERPII